MIRFESSTKINFISPALRAWGWGTLLIMQWASEVAYLSSYNALYWRSREARSTGNPVSSSCTPCQKGLPPSH